MSGEHTPGPWRWWTSNSWRRLKHDDRGITQNVLEPYVCRDGHPDLSVSAADMALIAAAPELLALVKRYRTETPLGNQPSMIAEEADRIIAKAEGRAP